MHALKQVFQLLEIHLVPDSTRCMVTHWILRLIAFSGTHFFPSTKLPINVLGYCTLRSFFYTGILVAYLTFNFLQQFVCKYYYSHCSSPYIVNIHTCSKILNLYVPLVTILFFFSRRNATKCFSFSFVSHYVFFTRIDLDFVGCLSLIYILIFFPRIFVDV